MRTMTRGWFGVAALCAIATTGLTLTSATEAAAQVCAQVKIEIVQELTLERQAFDAHMRITNGLTHLAIESSLARIVQRRVSTPSPHSKRAHSRAPRPWRGSPGPTDG